MLPPNSIVFVSDVHLSERTPKLTSLFLEFLEGPARHAQALYILGDLFDVWVGEDISAPFLKRLLNAFSALTDNHIPIHFIPGNRDFLISSSFLSTLEITRHDDRYRIDLHGIPTLLMHGDLLCTQDKGYQRYRKIAQHAWTRYCFLKLPQTIRSNIARKLREKSKAYQSGKSLSILDVALETVELEMQKAKVSQLIHGHVHRAAIHDVKNGKRVVLGDWNETKGSMIICTPLQTILAEFQTNHRIITQKAYALEGIFPLAMA